MFSITGTIIDVYPGDDLVAIIEGAKKHTVLQLHSGIYELRRPLDLRDEKIREIKGVSGSTISGGRQIAFNTSQVVTDP